MKQGLIEIRVNKLCNISERVKQFITEKSNNISSPFDKQDSNHLNKKKTLKAKRSLTDWRQLYNKQKLKLMPKNMVIDQNEKVGVDNKLKINCITSYYIRQNPKISNHHASFIQKRSLETENDQQQKFNKRKKQSLIDFAIAQNCYQKEILKDRRAQTANQKRFNSNKNYIQKRADYCMMGNFISQLSLQQKQNADNLADKYLSKLKNFKYVQLQPYNMVKIKDKYKINNSRFLDKPLQFKQCSRQLVSQKGLRYYQRA